MQYKRLGISLVFVCIALLSAFAEAAHAKSIDLTWNQNSENDIAGYRIRYGTGSGSYSQTADVGTQRTYRLSNVSNGQSYYFVVVAYNSTGMESNPSSEVRVDVPAAPQPTPTMTPTPPPPPPPTPEPRAADTDNDGLSDDDELARGTNPLVADTDGDGISDGQEVLGGTNPLDPGSGEPPLDTKVCTEWNGYLGGMYNIAELANLSTQTLNAVITLYNQAGTALSAQAYVIPPGQQRDSLVHDFPGRALNAYGNVCITHDGSPGDIDGRMSYYKLASVRSRKLGEQYDFAFSLPFSNGKRGRQYVFFDTFQRSANRADRRNLIANWIQLSNFGSERAGGVVRTFGLNGVLLGQVPLSLAPAERIDVSAHQYGPNQIGLVERTPDRSDIPFQLRNTHYIYDNQGTENSFSTAFQQEGAYPTGEDLLVPITTQNSNSAFIQVSNASNAPRATVVSFFAPSGGYLLNPITVTIAPKASWTMQLESQMRDKEGFAMVKGAVSGGLVGGVVQFGKNKKKGIAQMHLVPAKSASGFVLRGSDNTYLGQRSLVTVMNSSNVTQALSVAVVRSDGLVEAVAQQVLPPHGMRQLTVPQSNAYGVVTVQGQVNNSLVSWVQRIRPDFVIPTPVRE